MLQQKRDDQEQALADEVAAERRAAVEALGAKKKAAPAAKGKASVGSVSFGLALWALSQEG